MWLLPSPRPVHPATRGTLLHLRDRSSSGSSPTDDKPIAQASGLHSTDGSSHARSARWPKPPSVPSHVNLRVGWASELVNQIVGTYWPILLAATVGRAEQGWRPAFIPARRRPRPNTPAASVLPAGGGFRRYVCISRSPKCTKLYANADHKATQRTFFNPRTKNTPSPRYARVSALTVSAVAARSG